jgi:hypothetical protein
VSQALERVRLAARRGKKEKFTSLLHHVNPEMLRTAFYAMKRDAAPGVDGMTWDAYEQGLDRRIETLHAQVHSGAYRAQPSRRSYIPKEDGTERPLAVAALEDKIVQRAVAGVLNVIYEPAAVTPAQRTARHHRHRNSGRRGGPVRTSPGPASSSDCRHAWRPDQSPSSRLERPAACRRMTEPTACMASWGACGPDHKEACRADRWRGTR